MKKCVSCLVIIALAWCAFFAVPVQAEKRIILRDMFTLYYRQNGYKYSSDSILGGYAYWEKQIEENRWTGEDRPEPLMGDVNIDGKVTAVDALFALHFSVCGNVQSSHVVSYIKTPNWIRWDSQFSGWKKGGILMEQVNSKEYLFTYCFYNSPFFADVTKDTLVNSEDALEILKYCVGKAKNFPVGDFTTIFGLFMYYPWVTEYYSDIFYDLSIPMTIEEFCEKYNISLEETPTDR